MLTRKQHDLLQFIQARLQRDGVPPSFDEMKEALDLRSKSGIHRLITALEERGFIRRLAHRARAIEIVRLPETLERAAAATAPAPGPADPRQAASIELPVTDMAVFARALAPLTVGAGLDEIVLLARLQEGEGEPREVALRFSHSPGAGVAMTLTERPTEPMRPLDDYTQKVLRSRARGAVYPYELAPLLAGAGGTKASWDPKVADNLLGKIDEIAEIFWETKKAA